MEALTSDHATGKLLRRYYDRRAESSIGLGERFEIKTAIFGTSNFVTQNPITGKWELQDIPMDADLADIISPFATCELITNYAAGRITLRAVYPSSSAGDEDHAFTTLGILDEAGLLVAVLICKYMTLHKDLSFVVEAVIETNLG
ncbi:MAG TPA: hypothetical protein VGL07_17090 [Buttiauxella sp.]|jgi:hypothetical protein